MLVEAIHLLCNKKDDREFIRGRTFYANISYSLKIEKNTYVILRELHKFEMSLEAER